MNNINGIINVKKEAGFTSFDVVAKLRGITKQRKIGHTGTLDPDATGVLPVVLGNATKLVDLLTEKRKEYVAEFELGKTTDTQDISGKILSCTSVECDEELLIKTIESFRGDIMQIPPMYSALKIDGKKLCDLAREGIEVERKARPVTIYDIEIMDIHMPFCKIRVECSKGTYIRTLCHDIGQRLGIGAVMTSLVRTKSGMFELGDAYTLDEIETFRDEGKLDDIVLAVDTVFKDYAAARLSGESLRRAFNGNILEKKEVQTAIVEEGNMDKVRIYDEDGRFFALYRLSGRQYKIDKMFPVL